MPASLHMGWRHVLFANWPVDPAVVAPHVPDALALDTYEKDGTGENVAWLSAVPFTNVDVRPRALRADAGVALPELNLRTYVSHDGVPGVYFFSLDAEGILAVLGARVFHHLPYYYARIDLDVDDRDESGRGGRVRFASRRRHPGARPLSFRASYEPVGECFSAEADSLEAFLVERYRYYTESPTGALRYAAVEHEPWPLYEADVTIEAEDLFGANGFDVPATAPVHVYSPGVDTVASASTRVQTEG